MLAFENKPSFVDFRKMGSVVKKYSTKRGNPQYGVTLKLRSNSIVALADGRIAGLGHLRGYGLYVIVDHGSGWHSLYSHLSRVDRVTGSSVKRGASIGVARNKKLFLVVSYRGNPINPSEVF
ncbi:MAG TPA: peptidoglycan DD-metalloendopeptidase family protein [Turneriella sp.]|nr:peptidoglycan DD-metalloendopeptidase family protein [Turneriella sp.]